MNKQTSPTELTATADPVGRAGAYMPGFGNDFETEALPGALPQGMNSPQKCNYGLYGEQLSGTAFTAPSHQNERTWCYRIRPSVKHTSRFRKIDLPYWKSAPHIDPDVISLRPVSLGPGAPHGRTADLGHRDAHDDDRRGRQHPGRHGRSGVPRHRIDGRRVLLQRRLRASRSCRRRAVCALPRNSA